MATGRPGVIAFGGAYHGLGYGALATTWREHFRGPFRQQLNPHVRHLTYPHPQDRPRHGGDAAEEAALALADVERLLGSGSGTDIGCILVEPIQGRGGVVIPHASFLQGLRELASRHGSLLVFDEIFTGLGRTGKWFACEHVGVVPDLLCIGKSLGGGLPLSVCIGTPEAMAGWSRSRGEAIHTSTFLGHPMACATALVQLQLLEDEDWPARVAQLGDLLAEDLRSLRSLPGVGDVRGRGAMWGIALQRQGQADAPRAAAIVTGALRQGWLLLAAGDDGNVVQLTPPYVLAEGQRTAFREALHTLVVTTALGTHVT